MTPGPVQAPRRSSMWSQLRPLLGNRRRSLMALGISSVFSGFAEAGVLAIVAEATAVNKVTRVHIEIGALHVQATLGALLAVAFVLAVVRIALQVLISFLPARIAAEVQGRLRREMFAAFTRASWDMQSRDREGHLQEIMTSQIMQISQGAVQATTMVASLFTFAVLVVSRRPEYRGRRRRLGSGHPIVRSYATDKRNRRAECAVVLAGADVPRRWSRRGESGGRRDPGVRGGRGST